MDVNEDVGGLVPYVPFWSHHTIRKPDTGRGQS